MGSRNAIRSILREGAARQAWHTAVVTSLTRGLLSLNLLELACIPADISDPYSTYAG